MAFPASAETTDWAKVADALGKPGTEMLGGVYRVGLLRTDLPGRGGERRMDVEIAIGYSDDRPCTVTVGKPGGGDLLCRIVTPRVGIPQAVVEGLREARRLFAAEPWADGKPH